MEIWLRKLGLVVLLTFPFAGVCIAASTDFNSVETHPATNANDKFSLRLRDTSGNTVLDVGTDGTATVGADASDTWTFKSNPVFPTDYVHVDGDTMSGDLVISSAGRGLKVTDTTDAQGSVVAVFEGKRANPADGDSIIIPKKLSDSAGNQEQFAQVKAVAQDVTDGTEDGSFAILTMQDGTLSETFRAQAGRVGIETTAPDAELDVGGKTTSDKDAVTVADEGTASQATDTLEPTTNYVEYTCNDSDGCAITMSETNAVEAHHVTIANVSANTVDLADSSGVLETQGGAKITLAQWESVRIIYLSDRWAEIAH